MKLALAVACFCLLSCSSRALVSRKIAAQPIIKRSNVAPFNKALFNKITDNITSLSTSLSNRISWINWINVSKCKLPMGIAIISMLVAFVLKSLFAEARIHGSPKVEPRVRSTVAYDDDAGSKKFYYYGETYADSPGSAKPSETFVKASSTVFPTLKVSEVPVVPAVVSDRTTKQVEEILKRSKTLASIEAAKKWTPAVMVAESVIQKPITPPSVTAKALSFAKNIISIPSSINNDSVEEPVQKAISTTIEPGMYQAIAKLLEEEDSSFSFDDDATKVDTDTLTPISAPIPAPIPATISATTLASPVLVPTPTTTTTTAKEVTAVEGVVGGVVVGVETEETEKTDAVVENTFTAATAAVETTTAVAREEVSEIHSTSTSTDASIETQTLRTALEMTVQNEAVAPQLKIVVPEQKHKQQVSDPGLSTELASLSATEERSVGAFFAGAVASTVLGPTMGIALAAASVLVAGKDNEGGEAIRGAGKAVIGVVDFVSRLVLDEKEGMKEGVKKEVKEEVKEELVNVDATSSPSSTLVSDPVAA